MYLYFELRDRFSSLGCFEHAPLDSGPFRFDLKGTPYKVYVLAEQGKIKLQWKENLISSKVYSFEEILGLVSPELQEKLLFCLDLFV